jgi:hypothetical protein
MIVVAGTGLVGTHAADQLRRRVESTNSNRTPRLHAECMSIRARQEPYAW